jgi:hypothetical protein
MAADLLGIGVGGVDDDVDVLVAHEADQALDAAEAARARGARNGRRLARAAGQGRDRLEAAPPLEQPCQLRRFSGTAKDQNPPLRRAFRHNRLG